MKHTSYRNKEIYLSKTTPVERAMIKYIMERAREKKRKDFKKINMR